MSSKEYSRRRILLSTHSRWRTNGLARFHRRLARRAGRGSSRPLFPRATLDKDRRDVIGAALYLERIEIARCGFQGRPPVALERFPDPTPGSHQVAVESKPRACAARPTCLPESDNQRRQDHWRPRTVGRSCGARPRRRLWRGSHRHSRHCASLSWLTTSEHSRSGWAQLCTNGGRRLQN